MCSKTLAYLNRTKKGKPIGLPKYKRLKKINI